MRIKLVSLFICFFFFFLKVSNSVNAFLSNKLYVVLQINGQVLYGHSHQNASSIIKSAPSKVKIIFVRYQQLFSSLLKLL